VARPPLRAEIPLVFCLFMFAIGFFVGFGTAASILG
jgi:hypothetical protein